MTNTKEYDCESMGCDGEFECRHCGCEMSDESFTYTKQRAQTSFTHDDVPMVFGDLLNKTETLHKEILRYLPILEAVAADPQLWGKLTEGTGIATLNGLRNALR